MSQINSLLRRLISCFTLLLLISVFHVPDAEAQLEDSGDFISAGIDDANLLFKNYLEPFGKGFGAGLNSGWVQSAKSHGVLGFNISFRLNASLVPDVDQSFDVTSLALQRLEYANDQGDLPITPTLSGSNHDGPRMIAQREINVPGGTETVTLADFNMPPGIGVAIVPAPVIQAGVGIIRDTELTLRYLPPVNMPFDGSINLLGGSIKHGINQWIPGGNLFPVDLSVMAGYTSLSMNVNMNIEPEVNQFTRNPYENSPETWDNQSLDFESSGFTAMLLAGKNLPIVAFYGGVGIESSTTSILTSGSYPVTVDDDPESPEFDPTRPLVVQRYEDPIDLEYDGANSLRALIGMRLRLGIISINADYTLANYPIASVGLGISFR
jgi:hypothetical protein